MSIDVRQFRVTDREHVRPLAARLTEGVAPWRETSAVTQAVHGWILPHLVEVDVVGLHTPQAVLARHADVACRQPAVVGPFIVPRHSLLT